MELLLIRHAQSENNARPEAERIPDPPLTDLGHQQADRLARRVAELGITKLISSPFLRTLQTTEYVRQATGLAPEVRVELHETGGCMAGPTPEVMVGRPGMNRDEIESQFPGFQLAADIDERGWWKSRPRETEQAAAARAASLLANVRREFAETGHKVALVMHAHFKLRLLQHLDHTVNATPWNTSVTCLGVGPGGLEILKFNCVEHLPQPLYTN